LELSGIPNDLKGEEVEMKKWEINIFLANLGLDPSNLWNKKNKEGKSDFDKLLIMASEGWEPVSATPINTGGTTSVVMFTFKRPKE
jgi:hypothetical protein